MARLVQHHNLPFMCFSLRGGLYSWWRLLVENVTIRPHLIFLNLHLYYAIFRSIFQSFSSRFSWLTNRLPSHLDKLLILVALIRPRSRRKTLPPITSSFLFGWHPLFLFLVPILIDLGQTNAWAGVFIRSGKCHFLLTRENQNKNSFNVR